ncbi:MAG: pyridoxal phosphate-dependent aminotransferase [Verrucomicrobiales bacterium]|jgi:aspartate aminotransferase|nr:pyridoxal phosphate-dependent aminotransferase [Verrucomicrobiales bacterium]MDA9924863.1 pyridoxal phosphate-dependent aminotransferase [Verrucomicrobiales bacterium]MDB2496823.1 pyridoxal phosphate-dependent aminotransferase [Verrucomicrobiales bacterium]MDB3940555.1 pyridoxal phosphate-dependent aminotransferase [Verrucomicrobiales bacterium]MDC0251856.1 pyridoxal phosphate-dependent aminotransferase [bacterium]
MSFIAEKFSEIAPSQTLAITAAAKKMRDEGQDVASFGAGEPDFDTPQHIKDACIEALQDGKTKYTPATGIPELKEAVAAKFLLENGLEYEESQISINCGAKHSCYNAILACCDPEDEVIIPAPYWTSYPEMVRLAGAEPYVVETKRENGWKLTADEFEEAISGRTRMLILNSPNNPTGSVYSKEELEALVEVAESEDIIILSDEIYEKLVYNDKKHVSTATVSEAAKNLTITINGLSKVYSMTGWRLGYTAAPPEIAKAIGIIQSHTTSNPTSFAQWGGIAALQGDQNMITDMVEEYDMRRQYMMSRLQGIKNVDVVEPEGAFYFLVDTTKIGLNSMNLTEKLLSRYLVAAVPGAAFGYDQSIRLSYATSLDIIKKGLDRFEEFCHAH